MMTDFEKLGGLSRKELFAAVGSSELGLESAEAERRLSVFGRNQIVFHESESPALLLLREFANLFPLLLLAAAILAFVADILSPGSGYGLIGAALLCVVVLNALVSFVQNYKARKLMLSFLDYIPKQVALLRDGRKTVLDATMAVPGDMLFVREGDKIPADCIVVRNTRLVVDESLLSGESVPVRKTVPGDGDVDGCKAYSGSTVLSGNGQLLVVRTGKSTRIGSISMLSRRVHHDLTPMQRELKDFTSKITAIAIGLGALFFGIGILIGHSILENLVFAIGIIVANVPEGLLPAVTLALTRSSMRMGRRHAIVKDILSVETLGSTSVICTDKTGTLTQNRLRAERFTIGLSEVAADDHDAYRAHPGSGRMTDIMGICNDVIAAVDEHGTTGFKGDPTEVALVEFVDRCVGYQVLRERFETVASRPFSVRMRYMSSTARMDGELLMAVKGAPENVIGLCCDIGADGGRRALQDDERRKILEKAEAYASQGLRVLALAWKPVDVPEAEIGRLVFAGLAALSDPPRPEVHAAVEACRQAGIRIIVMSGDKAQTVGSLARRLGIVLDPVVVEGAELAGMSREALIGLLKNREVVFARIAPEQKLGIVEALKEMGEVVAVTGDGVNDAPALKRADIGIAMGLRGTDVAREASDIILLDDNFATIVKAIEEGRCVYDNIRKFIVYVLTSNVPEIIPYIAYVLLPVPLAITVIQMLCVDLFTDMLPAIGLGNETPERDAMLRPPRAAEERLVSFGTFLTSYGFIGPLETIVSFTVFFSVLFGNGWQWGEPVRTDSTLYARAAGAFFAAVIFSQVGNVLACRTNRQSAVGHLLRFNPLIAAGIATEVSFIVMVTALPAFQGFFTTAPLEGSTWLFIATAPFIVFGFEELRKLVARKRDSSTA